MNLYIKSSLLTVLPICAALLLAGCGAASPTDASVPAGGRPSLPTGAEVRHPPAPAGNPVFLSLLSEAGDSYYQVAVTSSSVVTSINPAKWRGKEVGKTTESTTLVPTGATLAANSEPTAQVLLLSWVMWQDANSNGTREASEALPLMSHDRAVYTDKAVTVSFVTATPNMKQTQSFTAGWSHAAHFVYLPQDSATYQRTLLSDTLQRYELHEPTAITSQ
jgi:hypothetical protein